MAVRSLSARRSRRPEPVVEPTVSARAAGLRYVSDASPGIRRVRAGRGFSYVTPKGARVTDRATLERIRALVIPPAWTDVWVCPHPRGHLQATGRDARGRKQYRYHPRWAETRDETKYGRMVVFGEHLPGIRTAVSEHLGLRGLPREKVLATVVSLLDTVFLRVGNEAYERENESFGLTTLKDKHVKIEGASLHFRFRGKGGKEVTVDVKDRRIAAIVQRCRDITGQRLFQYVDDGGRRRSIDSNHVNRYLKDVSGQPFTAKDFRTWGGSVLALQQLVALGAFESDTAASRNVVAAIREVAGQLGNTPAVCRKCYVHPEVVQAYMDGTLVEFHAKAVGLKAPEGLTAGEAVLLALLRERLKSAGTAAAA